MASLAYYDMQEADIANTVKPTAIWRNLTISDIDSLIHIANAIHPDLPESAEVFAESVKLFPEGCLALVDCQSDELCGYVISHPICYRQPPALNNSSGRIVLDANQYYIHDLAILPGYHGCGYAKACMDKIVAVARRYPTTSLVSVYGTTSFWGRFGFVPTEIDEGLKTKLLAYGDDAVYLERQNEVDQNPPDTKTD